VDRLGLPHPTTAKPRAAEPSTAVPADNSPIQYQRVFQFTEATLAPYADLTFPSLAPGSAAWNKINGELLGISASDNGTLVALALAECKPDKTARLISLFVSPNQRRQGIATRLISHLSKFLQQQGLTNLSVNYQAPHQRPGTIDRLLPRLGWSTPQQIYLLLKGEADKLAAITWPERFPLPEGYRLVPWRSEYAATALELQSGDNLTGAIQSNQLEPQVSLALLHHKTLVGWVLVERSNANATRFSSVFVDKGHRSRGQALNLLVHAFRKQQAAGIPIARAAVPPHRQAMLRLVHRHLGQHLKTITAVNSSQRNLESGKAQER
jgi:GNAT superfamily N-acetyltransferase/L-amino acid N-acyltransferase YncA